MIIFIQNNYFEYFEDFNRKFSKYYVDVFFLKLLDFKDNIFFEEITFLKFNKTLKTYFRKQNNILPKYYSYGS